MVPALKPLYDYAWFVGFFAAGAAHLLLAPRHKSATAAGGVPPSDGPVAACIALRRLFDRLQRQHYFVVDVVHRSAVVAELKLSVANSRRSDSSGPASGDGGVLATLQRETTDEQDQAIDQRQEGTHLGRQLGDVTPTQFRSKLSPSSMT